jgi:predicted dehydrogenase
VQGKFRVAIAGTGFGEKYALGLMSNPEVELVGVFSRRPERAGAMADKFGIPLATRHFDQLLSIPYLDAVAIVTPNSTHAQLVQAATRAGKHVICDKPLALTGPEAERLLRAAEQAGVRHVTFVPYRFSPAAAAMKQAMTEAQAGRLVSVRAGWGVDLRQEPLRWRFQRSLSGPGVLADLGAHILDLLIWWVGPIRRVLGRCKTLVPKRPAEVGQRTRRVDVPDECWALLEFVEAGVGSLALSWNAHRNQQIEIEGDRGQLAYESASLLRWLEGRGEFDHSAQFTLGGVGRTARLSMPGREDFARQEDALAKMLGEVVSYLKGGERPEAVATFRDGAAVLRVIDAVEESSETGGWVEVAAGLR